MASVNLASNTTEAQDGSQKDGLVGPTLPPENTTCDPASAEQTSAKENVPEKTISNVMEQELETTSMVNKSAEPNEEEPGLQITSDDKEVDKTPVVQTDQDLGHAGKLVSWVTDVKDKAVSIMKMAATSVQDHLEQTKTVAEDANAVGQLEATSMDINPKTGDPHLPISKEELAKVAVPTEESAVGQESYYVRLGSLTSKARTHAYQYSVAKIQQAKENGQEILSLLHKLVDLINLAKKEAESTCLEVHEHLNQMLLDWRWKQPKPQELPSGKPEVESQSLTMTRNFSDQLQTICQNLASSVRGLPLHVEEQVQHLCKWAAEISSTLSPATSFQDLSVQFLAQIKEQLIKIGEGMDGVMNYVRHNTHLDWLVGPFHPQLTEGQEPRDPLSPAE